MKRWIWRSSYARATQRHEVRETSGKTPAEARTHPRATQAQSIMNEPGSGAGALINRDQAPSQKDRSEAIFPFGELR
jgi:hypothetical protein